MVKILIPEFLHFAQILENFKAKSKIAKETTTTSTFIYQKVEV